MFGHEMKTLMSVPYVKTLLDLDDPINVSEEMRKESIIQDSQNSSMPSDEQHILTLANISKLLDKVFPPMGEVFEQLDVSPKE
jgi:hypothetical protein